MLACHPWTPSRVLCLFSQGSRSTQGATAPLQGLPAPGASHTDWELAEAMDKQNESGNSLSVLLNGICLLKKSQLWHLVITEGVIFCLESFMSLPTPCSKNGLQPHHEGNGCKSTSDTEQPVPSPCQGSLLHFIIFCIFSHFDAKSIVKYWSFPASLHTSFLGKWK